MKWREASIILFDKKIPIKLKFKFYRSVVRPIILFGLECWAVKRVEQNMSVVEMRMFRWMR